MTKRLAIIPARGGSKRLPRKNILLFLGKPIIAYTIEAALESGQFERVVVSTEDTEIAEISRRFGAEVDIRPTVLATDSATVVGVCEEFLAREKSAGSEYDVLCCLYATAPLRTASDIVETIKLIEPNSCDFSMAVTRYAHYAHQALCKTEEFYLTPMWPNVVGLRSDVVGELVVGNGSTYCAEVSAFFRVKSFYGPRLRGYEMPLSRSIDIDTRDDFEMAEAMSKAIHFKMKPGDLHSEDAQ